MATKHRIGGAAIGASAWPIDAREIKGPDRGISVQAATQYALSVNFKAAKALGLTLPPAVLARADAVIE